MDATTISPAHYHCCFVLPSEAPADPRWLRGGRRRRGWRTWPATPVPLHRPAAVHQSQAGHPRVSGSATRTGHSPTDALTPGISSSVASSASRRQNQYRFCWYLPLARLRLRWLAEQQHPAELRLHNMRTKMFVCREQLQQHTAVRVKD